MYGAVGVAMAAIQASPSDISARPTTRIGRAPMRPLKYPASGATKAGIAVHGRTRSPASNGL